MGKSRFARWTEEKQVAKVRLHKLRMRVLGERTYLTDVERMLRPLPPPHHVQEAFLSICAIGGIIPYLGSFRGLECEPMVIRNCWAIYGSTYVKDQKAPTLNLWQRPRSRERLHDAELFEGWSWTRTLKEQARRKVVFTGSVEECLDQAKVLFERWETVRRLGGKPQGSHWEVR